MLAASITPMPRPSSASDIAGWNETVRRHAGDLEEDDDLNGDEVSHKDLPDVPGPQRY